MKSSVFLGMPAVVTVLNLLLAMFIIHRHHGSPLVDDKVINVNVVEARPHYRSSPAPIVNTYTNHYYPQPTRNAIHEDEDTSTTESPSATTSTTAYSPTIPKQHVSPTKWSLSRSSLANKQWAGEWKNWLRFERKVLMILHNTKWRERPGARCHESACTNKFVCIFQCKLLMHTTYLCYFVSFGVCRPIFMRLEMLLSCVWHWCPKKFCSCICGQETQRACAIQYFESSRRILACSSITEPVFREMFVVAAW